MEWLQIADLIPFGKDFEDSPGNYQGIMDQNIREPLQAKRDPRLPGTWDAQISVEAAIATGSGSQQQVDAFNQTELPNLLFKQAQDTAGIGQPNRAIAEMCIRDRIQADRMWRPMGAITRRPLPEKASLLEFLSLLTPRAKALLPLKTK